MIVVETIGTEGNVCDLHIIVVETIETKESGWDSHIIVVEESGQRRPNCL